jgi:tRNA threonylcarbamoyladenosine biosynthesis protein TsaE
MECKIQSVEELKKVAKELIPQFLHKVILFEGEMGAGKTTFIKVLVEEMGTQDEISSPTFSIVNEYDTEHGKVYHFDMYRIKSEEEAMDFGIEEYLYSGKYCFIEWPSKVENLLPEEHHIVKIIAEENSRTIIFA